MQLGQVFKRIRKDQGISQMDASKKCGISQSYLCQIEAGKRTVEMKTYSKLAAVYKTPLPFILWEAIELKDVPVNKRSAFKEIKPLVDNLIK